MGDPELILRLPIFSGVSSNLITQIAQHMEVLDCDSGEPVFQVGEEATHLYGVLEGEVDLLLIARDENLITDVQFEEYTHVKTETLEREIVVDSIGPGQIFGWSALTPSGHFTSKAVCATNARLLAIPAKVLKTVFMNSPEVGYPFMEQLADIISKRLANRTDKLLDGWSQAFSVNRI
jgi:CRP-like cAMP-binding protein